MTEEDSSPIKPVVLLILDGWGVAPVSRGNAIVRAKTPTMDKLIRTYPSMTLFASGNNVGLSKGEAGNAEIGHRSIGAGRIVFKDLSRIDQAISDGSFFQNQRLKGAFNNALKNKSALHLVGLLSSAKTHSSLKHLFALLESAKGHDVKKVYLHLFLDGRDGAYDSADELMEKLLAKLGELKIGKVASLSGRFYAMDRDYHWDRTALAYQAMVGGQSKDTFSDPLEAIKSSYGNKIYDEEFVPTVIVNRDKPVATINDRDSVVFFNFRSDRMRQLAKAFSVPSFDKFDRKLLRHIFAISMTQYDDDFPIATAFAPEKLKNTFAEVLSSANRRQLHIAETERYVHVTKLFNGDSERPFDKEDRMLIPSMNAKSYQSRPEMSAKEITKKTNEVIINGQYDFVVANLPNADMLAHTGDLKAAVRACEIVDDCVGKIVEMILAKDGTVFITASHGNAEELIDLQSGKVNKTHTGYPVPLIIVGREWEGRTGGVMESPNADLSLVKPAGTLADVAPTMLKIIGIKKPREMTGESLV